MNTHIITGLDNVNVFTYGKDSDMNTILGYISVPFTIMHGSAGAISRIIELARIKEMHPLFEKFNDLTGYCAGLIRASADELNFLAATISSLYININNHISHLESKSSQCAANLDAINKGSVSGSGYYIRQQVQQNEDGRERSENQIIRAKKERHYIESVISLLRSIVRSEKQSNSDFNLTKELPKTDAENGGWHYFKCGSDAGENILVSLERVEKSLNTIIKSCTSVASNIKNKEEKNALINACLYYYSNDGEIFRTVMELTEYVRAVMEPIRDKIKKEHRMTFSFNENY